MVIWPEGEQEIGRTPTIYNTVRPVWKACSFELPLLAPIQADTLHKEGGCGPYKNREGDNYNHRGTTATANAKNPREQVADIELTVQVWDEDEGKEACFLGELNFGAEALLELARGQQNLVSHSTLILMLHHVHPNWSI